MKLENYLSTKQQVIEEKLSTYLPSQDTYPEVIHQAMHYSVFAGGKRLRPILFLSVGELLNGDSQKLLPFACAMEMIHTYSLIHDDLPAIDNDDFRRGKPTNHKVFGEDIAILAGDALLNHAYQIMIGETLNSANAQNDLQAIYEIVKAAGTGGMIGGQVVDVKMANQSDINFDTVSYIHTHKTGALFNASIIGGALLSHADNNDLENLSLFSNKLGLAFQIKDDILDIEGDEEKMGKAVGSDIEQKKATYPQVIGLEKSKLYAENLLVEAKAALTDYGEDADTLCQLAELLVNREK